jgi:hypothetical protein
MTSLPGVSLLCPTYGRPPELQHLTEECVLSFLLQDYAGPKELVVLNDCPEQELVCRAPGVRVVNAPARYSSVGTKRNALVSLASYDLLALADDDDIFLPHRISLSVRLLGDADYWNPRAYWFLRAGSPLVHEQLTGYAHNAALFRRSAWEKVGGYDDHCRDDATMDAKLCAQCDVAPGWPLSAADSYYIYRWGVSNHLSGNADPDAAYRLRGRQRHTPGVFELWPHWRAHYRTMVAHAIAANASRSAPDP